MPDNAITYLIFGRATRVVFGPTRGSQLLRDELALYPRLEDETPPDLTIHHTPVPLPATYLRNPAQHVEEDNGFVARFPTADVRFGFDNENTLRTVHFHERSATSAVFRTARKVLDMQFTSREERVGMIFHELALLPATHFDPERALIHASAFVDREGRATLIGGTGGVGKTSLELELCLHHGYTFLADDVTAVDTKGSTWPNLAYPKIYAYNLKNNDDLTHRIMKARGIADRGHWWLHKLRGPDTVRRRLSPSELYGSFRATQSLAHRYVILVREARSDLSVEVIDPDQAAAMSVDVMATEYHGFHNHLYWHAFNRHADHRVPVDTVSTLLERWRRILAVAFQRTQCELIRVPISVPHTVFKERVVSLLTE